jgi:hypothetical protein
MLKKDRKENIHKLLRTHKTRVQKGFTNFSGSAIWPVEVKGSTQGPSGVMFCMTSIRSVTKPEPLDPARWLIRATLYILSGATKFES